MGLGVRHDQPRDRCVGNPKRRIREYPTDSSNRQRVGWIDYALKVRRRSPEAVLIGRSPENAAGVCVGVRTHGDGSGASDVAVAAK